MLAATIFRRQWIAIGWMAACTSTLAQSDNWNAGYGAAPGTGYPGAAPWAMPGYPPVANGQQPPLPRNYDTSAPWATYPGPQVTWKNPPAAATPGTRAYTQNTSPSARPFGQYDGYPAQTNGSPPQFGAPSGGNAAWMQNNNTGNAAQAHSSVVFGAEESWWNQAASGFSPPVGGWAPGSRQVNPSAYPNHIPATGAYQSMDQMVGDTLPSSGLPAHLVGPPLWDVQESTDLGSAQPTVPQ